MRFDRAFIGAGLVAVLLSGCGGDSSTNRAPRTDAEPTKYSSADGLRLVKRIYDPYARAEEGGAALLGDCFGRRACPMLDNDVTPELTARLSRDAGEGTGTDPVICAQNTPLRVEYDPPARSGTTLTIVVHTFYSGSDDNPISVTVDLNTLRLGDIACLG